MLLLSVLDQTTGTVEDDDGGGGGVCVFERYEGEGSQMNLKWGLGIFWL